MCLVTLYLGGDDGDGSGRSFAFAAPFEKERKSINWDTHFSPATCLKGDRASGVAGVAVQTVRLGWLNNCTVVVAALLVRSHFQFRPPAGRQ